MWKSLKPVAARKFTLSWSLSVAKSYFSKKKIFFRADSEKKTFDSHVCPKRDICADIVWNLGPKFNVDIFS